MKIKNNTTSHSDSGQEILTPLPTWAESNALGHGHTIHRKLPFTGSQWHDQINPFDTPLEGDYDRSGSKVERPGGKNTSPVAEDDSGSEFSGIAGDEFETASLLANDWDANGDSLAIVSLDLSGTLGLVALLADGSVRYDPDGKFDSLEQGQTATDQFKYTIEDGRGGQSTASVTVTIRGETDPTVVYPPQPDDPPPPYYISAILTGDEYRYNAGETHGTPETVSFAFAEATPDYYGADSFAWQNFAPFTEEQRAAARAALQDISGYSNLSFVETSVDEADMVFGTADVGARGLAYYPGLQTVGAKAGDVWLDDGTRTMSFEPGSEAYKTLIHEIGHALGLSHPDLMGEEQSRKYTVMSYYHHPTMNADPSTHMLYDIAAIQYLYGANMNAAISDDVYRVADFDGQVKTLWDADGHDTFDMSGALFGVVLDLREGGFSSITANGADNLAIAFGTVIEDAIGSYFDDILIANEADNRLTGGAGADILVFDTAGGSDVITDFENGLDLIDLTEAGCEFSDLLFDESDGGTIIKMGAISIFLEQISPDALSAEDFIFA